MALHDFVSRCLPFLALYLVAGFSPASAQLDKVAPGWRTVLAGNYWNAQSPLDQTGGVLVIVPAAVSFIGEHHTWLDEIASSLVEEFGFTTVSRDPLIPSSLMFDLSPDPHDPGV